jgi:hypothetical protein
VIILLSKYSWIRFLFITTNLYTLLFPLNNFFLSWISVFRGRNVIRCNKYNSCIKIKFGAISVTECNVFSSNQPCRYSYNPKFCLCLHHQGWCNKWHDCSYLYLQLPLTALCTCMWVRQQDRWIRTGSQSSQSSHSLCCLTWTYRATGCCWSFCQL